MEESGFVPITWNMFLSIVMAIGGMYIAAHRDKFNKISERNDKQDVKYFMMLIYCI